jgi:tetratricopeptide (TPR) repeat protein
MRLDRAAAAINQLAPYIPAAKNDPDRFFATLVFYGRALIIAHRSQEALDLLLPLAEKDPDQWLDPWINILSISHSDAESATAWIEKLLPNISLQTPTQRLVLANGWYNVAQHYYFVAGFQKARDAIEADVKLDDAPVESILLYALICERLGDLDSAEAAYRRDIAVFQAQKISDPSVAIAKNNLACVLLQKGSNLPEAQKLAEEAIAMYPTTTTYYDSLARIQAKQGNTDAAIATYQKARKIKSNDVEILIGLADLLSQNGKRDEAMPLLRQIDAIISGQTLSPALKEQLDSVRSDLSSVQ